MAGSLDNTNPQFRARLLQFIAASGGRIGIGNAFRTRAQQAALFKAKPHLAAPPGRSNHERGLAADLVFGPEGSKQKADNTAWAHANAARFGLKFPMGTRRPGKKFEPWHVEMTDAPPTAYATATAPTGGGSDHTDHAHGDEQAAPGAAPDATPTEDDPFDPGYQLSQLERILTQDFDFSTPMKASSGTPA